MKKMTCKVRNQFFVALVMIALCTMFCGCNTTYTSVTKQDDAIIANTKAEVVTDKEKNQCEEKSNETPTDDSQNVCSLGLAEVSSVEKALDFLFEGYAIYPDEWKKMPIGDIFRATKHGKVGENINIDGCSGNLTRSNLSYFCDKYNSKRAFGRIVIQNSRNGKIYILSIIGELNTDDYERLTTTIVDGFYWDAIWLSPRAKFPEDSKFASDIPNIASKIDTLWNDDCAEKYPCIDGEVIFEDVEKQSLKDWYFSYFDTIVCKTASGEYVIVCGWNDYTDTIFYMSNTGIVETSEDKLDGSTTVMPIN